MRPAGSAPGLGGNTSDLGWGLLGRLGRTRSAIIFATHSWLERVDFGGQFRRLGRNSITPLMELEEPSIVPYNARGMGPPGTSNHQSSVQLDTARRWHRHIAA